MAGAMAPRVILAKHEDLRLDHQYPRTAGTHLELQCWGEKTVGSWRLVEQAVPLTWWWFGGPDPRNNGQGDWWQHPALTSGFPICHAGKHPHPHSQKHTNAILIWAATYVYKNIDLQFFFLLWKLIIESKIDGFVQRCLLEDQLPLKKKLCVM